MKLECLYVDVIEDCCNLCFVVCKERQTWNGMWCHIVVQSRCCVAMFIVKLKFYKVCSTYSKAWLINGDAECNWATRRECCVFARKIEIVQFASRTRQLFVRLLALVKWMNSASKVNKCGVRWVVIVKTLNRVNYCMSVAVIVSLLLCYWDTGSGLL